MIIYKTTNLINGKIYIGQDRNNNKNYYGSGTCLLNAIKKYKRENFKKEIIDTCNSLDELNEKEKYWISHYSSTDRNIGYNIREGGDYNGGYYDISGENNGMWNRTHTDDVKQILSQRLKGKTLEELYGEDKAKKIKYGMSKNSSGDNNPSYGKDVPKASCLYCKEEFDIRNINRWHGNNCSKNPNREMKEIKLVTCPHCLRELTPSNAGQYHFDFCKNNPNRKELPPRQPPTQETKDKISARNKGRILTEEHKAKIGNAGKGRIFSEEHKAKIGIQTKLRHQNNTIIYSCDHCDKTSKIKGTITKWHNDNCKHKK